MKRRAWFDSLLIVSCAAALSLLGIVPAASAQTASWRERAAHRWEADGFARFQPDAAPWWDFAAPAFAIVQPQDAGQDLTVDYNTYTVSGNEQWDNVFVSNGGNDASVSQDTGNNMTVSGSLVLGRSFAGNSLAGYTLNGGTLTAADEQFGLLSNGSFVQNGGLNRVGAGGVTLGNNTTQGVYSLNGGTLSTPFLTRGSGGTSGVSTVFLNGGTLQATRDNTAFMGGLSDVEIQSGGVFIDPNGFAITITQNLAGTGFLTQNGSGTLSLAGTNLYSGPTTINAGTLVAHRGTFFGGGAVNVNGGTLRLTGTDALGASAGGNVSLTINGGTVTTDSTTGQRTTLGTVSLTGGTLASGASDGTFILTAGLIINGSSTTAAITAPKLTLNSSTPFNVPAGTTSNGQDLRIDSVINGSAALIKNGAGTLVLTGANTYTGGTTVNGGTLVLTGANAYAGGTTVNGGTLVAGHSAGSNGAGTFASGSTVTVNSSGNLVLAGTNSLGFSAGIALGNLVINGGTVTTDGSANHTTLDQVTMTAGTLTANGPGDGSFGAFYLNGPINTNANGTTAVFNAASGGSVSLIGGDGAGGSVTFNVAKGTTASGADLLVSAPLTGTAPIIKTGAGTLSLAGSNTYTGATTVNAGTLAINGAGSLGAGNYAGNLADAGSFLYNSSTAQTLSGIISGAGTLTQAGPGTLTLTGTNTYTGGTTLKGGTLNVGSAGALGTGGTLSFTGGTLQYSPANTTDYSARFSGAANQAYNIDTNGQNVAFASALTASGTLTKQGAGTLSLAGSNTYTGATTVNAGTLAINGAGSLGAGNYAGNLADAGSFLYNSSTAQTLSGIISGAGTLTQAGPGTLTLTGTNTYTGGTTLKGGTLNVGSAGALGTGGTLSFTGGTLQYSPANTTDYSARFSGAANQAYNIDTNGQNVAFASALTASGTLTKQGAGTLSLTGSNTYTGATTVNAGTLAIVDNGSLSNTAVTINTGGTLTLSGAASVNIPNSDLTSNGTVTLAGGTLTSGHASLGRTGAVNQTGGAFTTGYMEVGTASGGDYGVGTYNLSAGSVTAGAIYLGGYLGGSSGVFNQSGGTVSASGLVLGVFDNFLQGGGAYNLDGGTLSVSSITGNPTLSTFNFNGGTVRVSAAPGSFLQNLTRLNVRNGGAIIDTNGFNITIGSLQHSNIAGDAATDGGLTKLGTGTLTLTGANKYTGPTNVNAGVLYVDSGGSLGGSAFNINGGGQLVVVGSGSAGSPNVTVNGTLVTNDSANFHAISLTVNNGAYVYGSSLTADNVVIGGMAGFNPFVEQGGGTFSVINSFYIGHQGGTSGSFTLYGGNLSVIGLFGYIGSYNSGIFTQWGGTSVFTPGLVVGDHALGNINLRGGSLTAGTLILGSAGTGTVNQSNGTLLAGNAISLGTDASSAGTYNFGGGTLTAGQIIGGPGTSTFNFNGGTLKPYASQSAFLQGLTTANVEDSGAIIDTNGFNVTVAQALQHSNISGDKATDGGLTKLGLGSLTLSGASTYTGATNVNAGTLLAANASGSATGTGAVTVNNGGTLGGNGTISGAVTVASGGTLAPGAQTVSRLTLQSTLTLQSGSVLAITLGGTTAGSGYDQVQAGGTLTLAGTLTVRTVNGFSLTPGMTFTILDNTSNTALTLGAFSNVLGTLYTDAAGDTFSINYLANADGGLVPNDVTLTYLGVNVVPEPSTWACLLMSASGLLLAVRRRLSRQKAA